MSSAAPLIGTGLGMAAGYAIGGPLGAFSVTPWLMAAGGAAGAGAGYAAQQDIERRESNMAGDLAAASQAALLAQQSELKKAADAKAEADAAAKAIADAKAKSDKDAADAATLLSARRRAGSSAYPSGAKGILGAAPVQLKTLLGS